MVTSCVQSSCGAGGGGGRHGHPPSGWDPGGRGGCRGRWHRLAPPRDQRTWGRGAVVSGWAAVMERGVGAVGQAGPGGAGGGWHGCAPCDCECGEGDTRALCHCVGRPRLQVPSLETARPPHVPPHSASSSPVHHPLPPFPHPTVPLWGPGAPSAPALLLPCPAWSRCGGTPKGPPGLLPPAVLGPSFPSYL